MRRVHFTNAGAIPAASFSLDSEYNSRFEVGKCYNITPKNNQRTKKAISKMYDPACGYSCVFRYEGRLGIHYCFREIYGDWTRTFTASQLIGKKIMEVKS